MTKVVVPLHLLVQLEKRQGDVLGASLGNTDKGAIIFNIEKNGLLDLWNRAHEFQPLRPGYIITEVNGIMGYWDILEELRKPGIFDMKITNEPPESAGANWFQDVTKMGESLEHRGKCLLKLQQQVSCAVFSDLPTARAGDCGVDHCAICMDDVLPDDTVARLYCKHAFHPSCAVRWLTQAEDEFGDKRQSCPLCCEKMVKVCRSPSGRIPKLKLREPKPQLHDPIERTCAIIKS